MRKIRFFYVILLLFVIFVLFTGEAQAGFWSNLFRTKTDDVASVALKHSAKKASKTVAKNAVRRGARKSGGGIVKRVARDKTDDVVTYSAKKMAKHQARKAGRKTIVKAAKKGSWIDAVGQHAIKLGVGSGLGVAIARGGPKAINTVTDNVAQPVGKGLNTVASYGVPWLLLIGIGFLIVFCIMFLLHKHRMYKKEEAKYDSDKEGK